MSRLSFAFSEAIGGKNRQLGADGRVREGFVIFDGRNRATKSPFCWITIGTVLCAD